MKIYIPLQGEYIHIAGLKGEFIYIYRVNIFTLAGWIYIHLQGEYIHIICLKGKFIYIYRVNIFTFAGWIYIHLQGEYIHIWRGNLYSFTGWIYSHLHRGQYNSQKSWFSRSQNNFLPPILKKMPPVNIFFQISLTHLPPIFKINAPS